MIRVVHRLVHAGTTVLIIEHNLEVIAETYWIIDRGPRQARGGPYRSAGGGWPRTGSRCCTGRYVIKLLKRRAR